MYFYYLFQLILTQPRNFVFFQCLYIYLQSEIVKLNSLTFTLFIYLFIFLFTLQISSFLLWCCHKLVSWYSGECVLQGETPTHSARVSEQEGRHDVSASITSPLAPSKARVSDYISSYNMHDENQCPASDTVCRLGHNGVSCSVVRHR